MGLYLEGCVTITDTKNGISVKQNLIWNSLGNIVYLLAQWVTTYLVTKILGFENAGIYSLAMSLSNTFATFALYGMRNFQASDTNREYNENTYISSRIITCGLSLLVCISFVLINSYDNFQKICIIAYMVFKISEAMVDVYHGIDQLNMRMDIIGKSYMIRGCIANTLFVIVILITKNLLLGIISLSVVSYVIIFLYDRREVVKFYKKTSVYLKNTKKLLIACFPIAIFTFIQTLFTTVPRYFIERNLGSELLGIYASISLPVILVQVLASYIFTPFITVFAEFYNNNDINGFKKLFVKITLILVSLAGVSIIGAILLGEWGLRILFGGNIGEYANLLIPLVACTILTAFSWFLFTIITVMRNFKAMNIAGLVSAVVCLGGSSFFIDWLGLNGASYVNILSMCVLICILLYFIIKYVVHNKKVDGDMKNG